MPPQTLALSSEPRFHPLQWLPSLLQARFQAREGFSTACVWLLDSVGQLFRFYSLFAFLLHPGMANARPIFEHDYVYCVSSLFILSIIDTLE